MKNDIHAPTTDPETHLLKKCAGKEAKLSYMAHTLMENRNVLIASGIVIQVTGTTEREATAEMLTLVPYNKRITFGGDKKYDTKEFVQDLREHNATPHAAKNNND